MDSRTWSGSDDKKINIKSFEALEVVERDDCPFLKCHIKRFSSIDLGDRPANEFPKMAESILYSC